MKTTKARPSKNAIIRARCPSGLIAQFEEVAVANRRTTSDMLRIVMEDYMRDMARTPNANGGKKVA